jgi:hypothetical protein
MKRIGTPAWIAAIVAASLVAGPAATTRAQLADPISPTNPVPWWVGWVFVTPGAPPLGEQFLQSTSPEAQDGQKFELLFGMDDAQDPQNPANDVIAINTTGGVIGAVVRNLPPGTHITALDDRINLRYFFPELQSSSGWPRNCDGGAPRIQLAFDLDGDGDFDANARGYVGHAQYGLGCVTGAWDFNDMTDGLARWDLWSLGGEEYQLSTTWDEMEAFVATRYPNHRVLSGALVDDSGGYAWAAVGQAYYDHFTMGDRTLEHNDDTVRGN